MVTKSSGRVDRLAEFGNAFLQFIGIPAFLINESQAKRIIFFVQVEAKALHHRPALFST